MRRDQLQALKLQDIEKKALVKPIQPDEISYTKPDPIPNFGMPNYSQFRNLSSKPHL